MNNLLAPLPNASGAEYIEELHAASGVCIQRIVSHGQASPEGFWYDQAQEEWVAILQGRARVRFEDGVVEMSAGDYLLIPAHRRHRVDWTDPDRATIWLAVHMVPAKD